MALSWRVTPVSRSFSSFRLPTSSSCWSETSARFPGIEDFFVFALSHFILGASGDVPPCSPLSKSRQLVRPVLGIQQLLDGKRTARGERVLKQLPFGNDPFDSLHPVAVEHGG